MKNKIDLSKILVKKTATKWLTANFEGTKKKYEIRALSDGEQYSFRSLFTDGDVHRTRNIYVHLLCCGLGIDQRVAAFLYDNVSAEAIRVGDAIFEFSGIYTETKMEEAETAEKNLPEETDPSQP